jgi:hypothetical protein
MTQYQLKRRAIKNFRNFDAPKNVRRHYQRQWLHWVNHLGERWLLASPAQKGTYYV